MDSKYYVEYYDLERSHWWFKARLNILRETVQKVLNSSDKSSFSILNVGAATGATSEMLQRFGEVTSLEYDKECCEFLLEKTGIKAINASLTELPFKDESFDIICAFDVIEHIENDTLAVYEIQRVLKKDGLFFLTVPAYQFLWSNHDVVNHHFRRYTLSSFRELVNGSGLKITYKTYFNFWLFPPIAFIRLLLNLISGDKKAKTTSGSDNEILQSSGLLNRLLFNIFHSEKHFLNKHISLPFGVSILVSGEK